MLNKVFHLSRNLKGKLEIEMEQRKEGISKKIPRFPCPRIIKSPWPQKRKDTTSSLYLMAACVIIDESNGIFSRNLDPDPYSSPNHTSSSSI